MLDGRFIKYEKDSMIEVTNSLKKHGWLVWGITIPPEPGFPDILALKDGAAIFCEVKQENGKLSSVQRRMHKLIAGHGFRVYTVWNASDVSQMLDMFEEHYD